MDTLTSIKVFQQVVESGSFVGAAERLIFSKASVSKHIMYLEKRLGVRLLNRSSRALSLTEPGRVYFERSKTILDDLESTELQLASLSGVPRGTLRITCPTWMTGHRLAAIIARYQSHYPEVVVDVSFDDRVSDLVAEGYDLALRVMPHKLLPAGLIARPLRAVTVLLGGSREYLQRNGTPKSPEELGNHRFIAIGDSDSLTLTGPNGKVDVPLRVVARSRSMPWVVNAVAAGIGLAALPDIFFEDEIFNAKLKPVLRKFPLETLTVYVVYVSRKYLPFKIRSFIDFVFDPANAVRPKLPAAD